MEQFSHDLTIALEETSRVRAGHCWGGRRRTRSTGNLPSAPQPTEDSSSSPGDGVNDINECPTNSIQSDSDDRQDFKLSLSVRQPCLFGNFESDSLNENFSPTRPSTRRKRKFKRMAVEYETTPSTPGNSNSGTLFPVAANAALKKRVIKHTSQENYRASLMFCGKRKRSHRDRYHDYEHYRLHSSSVPRQRDLFTPKNSYFEYRNRNRNAKPCERILPLNQTIVSKIEKISQDSASAASRLNSSRATGGIIGFPFNSSCLIDRSYRPETSEVSIPDNVFKPQERPSIDPSGAFEAIPAAITQKSNSFDSSFGVKEFTNVFPNPMASDATTSVASTSTVVKPIPLRNNKEFPIAQRKVHGQSNAKPKHSRRHRMRKMQLQFDDPNGMDCAGLNEFLSSSSLSSSDSEAAITNESDREGDLGDDELTDWPGNEAMVNFASKNDFKRAKQPRKPKISGTDDLMMADDDTLMSADEMVPSPNPQICSASTSTAGLNVPCPSLAGSPLPPSSLHLPLKYTPAAGPALSAASMPIDIAGAAAASSGGFIESEMSGETSNHFLSSTPPSIEVREFRAGCRRVREERPGFTIFTSVNEHLSRFLQDSRQAQLVLPYTDSEEHVKLMELAKLYSLTIAIDNGRAVLSKTINTTQAVKISQSRIPTRFLSDFKRRCYGTGVNDDDSESTEMAS